MSERRPPDHEEEEFERPPTPLWKRKGVLILAVAVIALLAWIFTRSSTIAPPPPSGQDGAIAVHQPYEGPPPIKVAAPTTVAQPPPPSPPPIMPALNPKSTATARPAMISYPVHVEPLKEEKPPPEPDKTGMKFNTASLPGMKASPAFDQTYWLMPGLLPIVLDYAIDSSLTGDIQAHLPGPVYSPKGLLLMESGTIVTGKYQSMQQNGVNRLEAVSTVAYTPNGVVVPLTGQSLSDDLGRTGLSGTIDHRYIERFGGAVLLDLSQTALGIVQANVSKGGNTYLSFNGSDQLANQILQSTINLPPIFTKNQGSMIAIKLNQPISFVDSYRVVGK